MTTLVCGSLAYDTIMVFPDQFKRHILPDQIHILNVAFLVPEMRREFGGTAGNIAYNLKLLGEDALIMATVGHDFTPYAERLARLGLADQHVRRVEGEFTAQAFITTDLDDNQITAFHPGAMSHAHLNRIADAPGATLGIVSPDGGQGMIEHARDFAAAGIPYIFDPGQGLPMFSGPELLGLIDGASGLALNDYEARIVEEMTAGEQANRPTATGEQTSDVRREQWADDDDADDHPEERQRDAEEHQVRDELRGLDARDLPDPEGHGEDE